MPPRKKRPLDRRLIAEAALRWIDAAGLDDLSMRKLGGALGVEAMAVYHHYESKAQLLDGVVDLLLDEVEPALLRGDAPLERLRACFEAIRGLAIVHPHAFLLLAARRFRTPRALDFYETLLGVFFEAGFDSPSAARFFRLVAGYTVGAGLAEIGSRGLQPHPTEIVLEDYDDPEHHPRVTAVVPHLRLDNLGAVFAFGLDVLFDAMRRHLGVPPSPETSSRSRRNPAAPARSRRPAR